MRRLRDARRMVVTLCAVVLAACATPLPPSGGPADETPPAIVETEPAPGAVNVSRPSIRITFSEYVDESSFNQALSITPEPVRPPEIVWSRRTVEIRMADELRPNTTYVVTLDTGLRDIRSVALSSPITFAFSTGPVINAGTIAGRVVRPDDGEPVAGADVFAYAVGDEPDGPTPDVTASRPAYRTQTDQSGRFLFEYMTEQDYFIAGVRDENRNLLVDRLEPYAAPPVAAVPADTTPVALDAPWVLARLDTTAPEPLSVQSLSASRHALRFSEPVHFAERNPDLWALADSATGRDIAVDDLYLVDNPQQIVFTTPPLESAPHIVRSAAVIDTSGNPVVPRDVLFRPAEAADTVQLRFRGFAPVDGGPDYLLPRGIEPGVRFNRPVSAEQLGDVVRIVDSTGTPLAFSAVTQDGTTYRLLFEPSLQALGRLEIRVDGSRIAGPDSVFAAVFERLPESETGEIGGIVTSSVAPVIVEAYALEVESGRLPPVYEVAAEPNGSFLLQGVPAGTYRLRAIGDADENGRWTPGILSPYRTPEPLTWTTEPVRVRARWETSLPDTLRIPAVP